MASFRDRRAALDALPLAVSEDLKWFLWNTAWQRANTRQGEEKLAKNDEAKSRRHLAKVQAKKLLAADLLDALQTDVIQLADDVISALQEEDGNYELRDPDTFADVEPPEGATHGFYVRLLVALAKMAVTIFYMAAHQDARELEQEFSEEWERLGFPQQPQTPQKQPSKAAAAETAMPAAATQRKGRGSEPLMGMPALSGSQTQSPSQAADRDIDVIEVPAQSESAVLPEDYPPGTALSDKSGNPVRVGSAGLWLGSKDFVVACPEGIMLELHTALEIGPHGAVRCFPEVSSGPSSSSVWKQLFGEGGRCPAGDVQRVRAMDAASKAKMAGAPLQRLQSFENARAVKARLGHQIVKGWAVYDLLSMGVGEGYLAERYWWNTTGEDSKTKSKGWVDFSPWPEGLQEMVLAESAEAMPPLRQGPLRPEQQVLAEGLLCLRWPDYAVDRSIALGTSSPVLLAVQHALQLADSRSAGAARRALASASVLTARPERFEEDDESQALVADVGELLRALSRLSTSDSAQEQELDALLEDGNVDILVSLMSFQDIWVSAPAAAALACCCHQCPRVQSRALGAGAAEALALFLSREDMLEPSCYAAEAAYAVWTVVGQWAQELVDPKTESRQQRQPRPSMRSQEEWQEQYGVCKELQADHSQLPPRQRRGHSWGRTLAFAQVVLGKEGVPLRRGTPQLPFVIWVLGCQDLVEGSLAEEGYFEGANWLEMAPTVVVLLGPNLRRLRQQRLPSSGGGAVVHTASYEEIPWLGHFGLPPPDMAAVLMPEVRTTPGGCSLPEEVLDAVARVPVVISQRFAWTTAGRADEMSLAYRRKLGQQLLLPKQTRCLFSSSGSRSTFTTTFDDNGWIFAVKGEGALRAALSVVATPEVTQPFKPQPDRKLQNVIFWGILDIKYDTSRPVLDRVKILETGDGQTSKFSHDGASLKDRFDSKYKLDKNDTLEIHRVISADKKLTHDLIEEDGFGHLIPKQACFPRHYTPELAKQLQEELELEDHEQVILKLCNRSRAAGVVVTPVAELDDVLEELLQPPADLESWFEARLCKILDRDVEGAPLELGLGTTGSFEEQKRHWWGNESPVFVAETLCKSVPVHGKDGLLYDGTLRVGFALRRREPLPEAKAPTSPAAVSPAGPSPLGAAPAQGPAAQLEGQAQSGVVVLPEDVELEWMGGYWKLPKSGVDSGGLLRECVVSAAKVSGTAPVDPTQLLEIFAALDTVVQQLYGKPEPSSSELADRYKQRPELAGFLISKLAMMIYTKRPAPAREKLDEVEKLLAPLDDSPSLRCLQAYVKRARGLLELLGSPDDQACDELFAESLRLLPSSPNALHLMGLRAALQKQHSEAVLPLNKSMLLDPDFKGVYVNLGLTYLNLQSWTRCIKVSEAGLTRHPDEPRLTYHIAVSYSQLALNLVNSAVEETEEMAEAKAEFEKKQERKEQLIEEKAKADAEFTERDNEWQETHRLYKAAKTEAEKEIEALKSQPIDAGVKLKIKEDAAVFASFDSTNEIRYLTKGHSVTAKGPPQTMDGYVWVPIEPNGVLDNAAVEPWVSAQAKDNPKVIEAKRVHDLAGAAMEAAQTNRKNLRQKLEEPIPKPTVPKRAAARLLHGDSFWEYEHFRKKALEAYQQTRENEVAKLRRRGLAPFLDFDDAMVEAMESGQGPWFVDLPPRVGWQSPQYRAG